MKVYRLVIIVAILMPLSSFSQDCYKTFYDKGVEHFRNDDFDAAIKSFEAAKVCSDKPTNNDVDDKIVAAQNGFIASLDENSPENNGWY